MMVARRIFTGFLLMLLLTVGIATVGWRGLASFAGRVDAASAAQALVGDINSLALSANRALARESGADDAAVAQALAKARARIGEIGALDGDDAAIAEAVERMRRSVDTFELAFREDAAQQLIRTGLAGTHFALVNRFQTIAADIAAVQQKQMKEASASLTKSVADAKTAGTALAVANYVSRFFLELRAGEARFVAMRDAAGREEADASARKIIAVFRRLSAAPSVSRSANALVEAATAYRTALAAAANDARKRDALPGLSAKLAAASLAMETDFTSNLTGAYVRLQDAQDNMALAGQLLNLGTKVIAAAKTAQAAEVELLRTDDANAQEIIDAAAGQMFEDGQKIFYRMKQPDVQAAIEGLLSEIKEYRASLPGLAAAKSRQVELTRDLDASTAAVVAAARRIVRAETLRMNDGQRRANILLAMGVAIAIAIWLVVSWRMGRREQHSTEKITFLARHDVLTGLANRAEFNEKLEEASKRLKRNGGAVTILVLDLDRFKAVNDTLGHPAGDQLLVEVARRLQATLRETDVLARLGGDEFAIIQEGGPGQHEGAIALGRRIIKTVAQPFDLNGQEANVDASIGIALAPEHGVDPEELLKSADLALYDVKANGRNDFRVFQTEMLESVHTQRTAESELRDAIARDEFELHYQPVVDPKTRGVCGVEALIRWRHPTKGIVAPDQFIPLAESTGLIVPLGEGIIRQACRDALTLPAHIKVAINISAVQFRKGGLFDFIFVTLVETGLAPERLELEITETSLLENQQAHLTTMRQLKNLGISMALDDFGTGYSSTSYMTNFPFDKIKIDKSFTQGALKRRDCAAVVSSVLALAQGLGTLTTAEGVETEEQLEYMCTAGVDLVQGYLFGRPVPISQLHHSMLSKEMVGLAERLVRRSDDPKSMVQ